MLQIHGITIIHISDTGHRTPYLPGMIIDTAPQEVQTAAAELWTDEAVLAWRESMRAEDGELPDPRATARMHRADFLLALHYAGFLPQIEAFVASPDASPECKILWHNTTMFHRDDPLLNQMAAAMGFTETDIDNVFGIGGTHGE